MRAVDVRRSHAELHRAGASQRSQILSGIGALRKRCCTIGQAIYSGAVCFDAARWRAFPGRRPGVRPLEGRRCNSGTPERRGVEQRQLAGLIPEVGRSTRPAAPNLRSRSYAANGRGEMLPAAPTGAVRPESAVTGHHCLVSRRGG